MLKQEKQSLMSEIHDINTKCAKQLKRIQTLEQELAEAHKKNASLEDRSRVGRERMLEKKKKKRECLCA